MVDAQKMMKKQISLLMMLGLLLTSCSTATVHASKLLTTTTAQMPEEENQGQLLPIEAQARMGNEIVELEVTRTPRQKALGLMYRDSLAANHGMLFSFDPPQLVGFWMKNVKIPLDMVFLREGEIKAIEANVPPCHQLPCPTYSPAIIIDQVIELRGGRAAELGLQPGEHVTIEFFSP